VRRKTGKELSADEVLVNASSDVTAALRRTHQLMQSELSRSRFAQETLEQSTAALADLGTFTLYPSSSLRHTTLRLFQRN
jgi:protein transport protein SEC20